MRTLGFTYEGVGRPAPVEVEQLGQRLMEAIILAGGRAERLGDAAGGKPKSLVFVVVARSRRTR